MVIEDMGLQTPERSHMEDSEDQMRNMFNTPCGLCKNQITEERQAKNKSSIISTARMTSNTVFEYGLSGAYQFSNHSLPLKEGDYVCIDCMEANKFEPYLSIECSRCHKRFRPSMGSEPDSHGRMYGWGCCGHVESYEGKLGIGCGFGSRHDCSNYPFTGEPTMPEKSIICDDCIDQMVAAGEVTKDNSFWENKEANSPYEPEELPPTPEGSDRV